MHHNIIFDFGAQYELIDCGNGYKLEKFGNIILSRPEPQALWDKILSQDLWDSKYHAHFTRDKAYPEKGMWTKKNNTPYYWHISYKNSDFAMHMKLELTSFKHIGLFPEQCANWQYIYKKTKILTKPKVLNLFAYTGGASLAAKYAGAEVVHVDAVKQVITWANENKEINKLHDIVWVVEDVLKFVKREVRRGKLYDGIIIDPPAYGRGPEGEKWILEDTLNTLLKECKTILSPNAHAFMILNMYAMGYSPTLAYSILKSHFADKDIEYGELIAQATSGALLPMSVFARF
ncbi:MAG: class I SAM-dependent methyltransferase [Cytophagales bacterium]|nr:class I SAM-dependent methyltransferase [Cytophagales bacterium]